jgi:nitronate monooxygenase
MTGDLEAMALYAGQGAGRLTSVVPAGERLRAIASEASEILSRSPLASEAAPLIEPSSPACHAAKADDGYMGYLTRDELIAELNVLLEAERAGARVGARLVVDCEDPALKALSRTIHADEVRWCRALFGALGDLGAEPSSAVGGFYEQASAIEDVQERLAFVNRGQGWVVRKLRTMLPKVRDDALHSVLSEMLTAHEVNIASANAELEARRDV